MPSSAGQCCMAQRTHDFMGPAKKEQSVPTEPEFDGIPEQTITSFHMSWQASRVFPLAVHALIEHQQHCSNTFLARLGFEKNASATTCHRQKMKSTVYPCKHYHSLSTKTIIVSTRVSCSRMTSYGFSARSCGSQEATVQILQFLWSVGFTRNVLNDAVHKR
eukprot:3995334-Amphidinium_carterae.1